MYLRKFLPSGVSEPRAVDAQLHRERRGEERRGEESDCLSAPARTVVAVVAARAWSSSIGWPGRSRAVSREASAACSSAGGALLNITHVWREKNVLLLGVGQLCRHRINGAQG
ncbi:hypothetical protein MHYP_G00329980 [Metynnis hypsauchen]